MYILGLSGFAHESSACLIKDGQIRCLIEEERLNRKKHTWEFPKLAIQQCLASENISINDINAFTFFWDPKKEVTGNIAHVLRFFPESLGLFTAPSGCEGLTFVPRVIAMAEVGKRIAKEFGLKKAPHVHFVEHHLAHAASAFYPSPFKEAAILTMDGRGESASTVFAVGKGNRIEKIKEICVPHSLGHLYAAITDHLGFKPFFDEWKVMGMSAYGRADLVPVFEDILQLTEGGGYELNLKYFKFHVRGQSQWGSDYLIQKLGPKRLVNAEYEPRHFDIAYGLQRMVERAGVHAAKGLYEATKLPSLCMTGGVMLNCLMNKRIIEETPFTNFFIQPIANDAGTSLGGALYHYHHTLGNIKRHTFDSIYLGPEFANEEIELALKKRNVAYEKCDDIAAKTAKAISEGKIVGWFQGRMEAGPRALGNRSIVADPRRTDMKDRLNARVKKREFFRPFAPSVLEEKASEYFVLPKNQPSPHMILVGDVKPLKRMVIPAVTHADATARVHTVSRQGNARYWELINAFEKLTGVPVVINTSFNENEPVVCTPKEAVDCFLRTDFDVLAIGDYLVNKNG